MENELRESAVLEHVGIRIDDPQKEGKRDYWKGRIDAILILWQTRNAIMKRTSGKKTIKGEKYANEKTKNHEKASYEADE